MKYDVRDMYNAVLCFAASSTHNAEYCINLVEKIIEYKQDNYETSEIEKEIDSLIYEIYDLTDEEVQIIEQN